MDRADKDGVATVAKDLGIRESQLYAWRQKRRLEGLTTEEEKLQHGEIARLKREMARLEEENTFLKKAAVSSTGRRNASLQFIRWRAESQSLSWSLIQS